MQVTTISDIAQRFINAIENENIDTSKVKQEYHSLKRWVREGKLEERITIPQ
jgi:hypothetical protein